MGEKLEAGEIYRGPCGVLRDSNWLTAETLPVNKDTVVQIEAVVRRKNVVFKNETKTSYGSLRFRGASKELGLCATHIKVLKALFGPDTTAWFDQWVSLYVDDHVQAFGAIVSAVRIRARKPEPPKAAAAKATAESIDRPLPEAEMAAEDAKRDKLRS
jgi:hypothetical protein